MFGRIGGRAIKPHARSVIPGLFFPHEKKNVIQAHFSDIQGCCWLFTTNVHSGDGRPCALQPHFASIYSTTEKQLNMSAVQQVYATTEDAQNGKISDEELLTKLEAVGTKVEDSQLPVIEQVLNSKLDSDLAEDAFAAVKKGMDSK